MKRMKASAAAARTHEIINANSRIFVVSTAFSPIETYANKFASKSLRRFYFSRDMDFFCSYRTMKGSPQRRSFTSDTFITTNQGGKYPATQVLSTSSQVTSQESEPQNVESLLNALMLRSREITTQASNEIRSTSHPTSTLEELSESHNSNTTGQIVKNSIDAADVLLSLTSHVLVKNYFQTRLQDNLSKEDFSLHYAFVSVTTWICSILSSITHQGGEINNNTETNLLLKKLLELTSRSTELLLPLPLPTYRNIANRIARYYDAENGGELVIALIDLYVQAENSVSASGHVSSADCNTCFEESDSQPFFFFNPLIELIHRRKYLDAVRIMEGMIKFKVSHLLVPSSRLQLLILIKEKVDEIPHDMQVDAKNLKVLVDLIEKPLLHDFLAEKNKVRDFIDRLNLAQLDDSDDDDSYDSGNEEDNLSDSSLAGDFDDTWDLNSDNVFAPDDFEYDNYVQGDEAILMEDNDKLNELVASIQGQGKTADEGISKVTLEVATSIISKVRQLRQMHQNVISDFSVDPPSPKSSDNLILNKGDSSNPGQRLLEIREDILSDSVYVRDDDVWKLPDITAQLAAVDKRGDLRFSRDYEDSLLREILSEEMEKLENVYNLDGDNGGEDNDDDIDAGDFSGHDDDDDNDGDQN